MEFEISFGAWITRRRKALDLTREQLTNCVGCSVSGLRKVETDERRPSHQVAEHLARCLQVSAEQQRLFVQVARGVAGAERLGPPLAGLAGGRPAPLARRVVSNLPIPATPLIGRQPELAALEQLLADPHCRLLTIVGPGGIGKTRLALEAAAAQRGRFTGGVHFVPVAPLTSPGLIVPAIADVLGHSFSGGVEPQVQLLNLLRGRSLLLVLDNLEHLLEAGPTLAEILREAPGVKLLVTSSERLNLQGEWLFDLQGLPVPPAGQVDRAEQYSSVALFLHSARRVQAGFALEALEAEERQAIVRICQLLEGMPLAVELAAAWVRVLSCGEIAAEIEHSLDFLAGATRDMPERHQSLRAVFCHSWNLLSTEEQRLLSHLAVFQGGFEREAAQQVAGASLQTLSALVAKSLVRWHKNGRYDLLEVVRQYALTQLARDPEEEASRDRHSEFYLGLLRHREAALKGSAQREALRELTDEIDNVRAAWDWALRQGQLASLEKGLRCLGWLYEMRGWFAEGYQQLELVVEACRAMPEDEDRQRVLGRALAQQGLILFRQGQFERAQSLCQESLDILRPFGDPALLLDALVFSGVIMFLTGAAAGAHARLVECLDCARAAGEPWFAAYALFNMGYITMQWGRQEHGYEQMLTALAQWRALGDPRSTALGLNYISPIAIRLGRYDEAQAYLQDSLALCTEVGDRWGVGTAYRHLGLLALARGEPVQARALIRTSLDTFAGFITGWDVVRSLVYLGDALAAAGDWAEARRTFRDALREAVEARATPLALDAIMGLAALHARDGETECALGAATVVLNHVASTQEARERARELCTRLEPHLTGQQIETVTARATTSPFEAAVENMLRS
jgi:predicted ATPase/transcriptional regulator with XRE-family HTH domain